MEKQEVQKLAYGTGITFLGGVVGAGFTYVTGVAISRLVGSELLGVYYLSLIWLQLLSAVSRFGFSDALLRFLPPQRRSGRKEECERIVKTVLGLGGLFSVALGCGLFFLLPPLGRWRGWDPMLISYLQWFFALLPLQVIFILLLMVVQSYQHMIQVVLARDFIQPAALFIFTILFLKLGIGEQFGLIGGVAASLVVGLGLIGHWAYKAAPGTLRVPGWMALGPLFFFAIPVMTGDVSHLLYRWIDTLLVSHFFEFHEVGIYSAAIRTALLLTLIPMSVNAIYATMASGYFHTGESQRLEYALQLSLRWSLILGLPIVLLFILGQREILQLWGSEFAEGGLTLATLAVAQLFAIPGGILGYTLLMCNRHTLEVINTFVLLALVMVANFLLIPKLGLVGAATSLLLVNTLGTATRWWQVLHQLKVHPLHWNMIKPLVSIMVTGSLGFGATVWLRNTLGGDAMSSVQVLLFLSAISLIVGLIYLLSLFLMGFEEEDKAFIDMILSKWQNGRGARSVV